MNHTEVDYIIIGQGLSGTFLSYYLLQAGKKIIVLDECKPATASKFASGIINPVTGRRIVKTWRIDELLPFAQSAYKELSCTLQTPLIMQCDVLDFHTTAQMEHAFDARIAEEPDYLYKTDNSPWEQYFEFRNGIGKVRPCLLINVNEMLDKWRMYLVEQHAFIQSHYDHKELAIFEDHIAYKEIKAAKIIFCDGVAGFDNPYFKNLPFAFNKGEALIASIPGLPANNIYKHGITIAPWQSGLFWIGSSYEWNFKDDQPTNAFKERTMLQLKSWLKLPFVITDHFAAVRPANVERRPFAGLHPLQKNIGMLNGMGTKGCSLAPFFANQLADLLTRQTPVYPDADISRFAKVLARNT